MARWERDLFLIRVLPPKGQDEHLPFKAVVCARNRCKALNYVLINNLRGVTYKVTFIGKAASGIKPGIIIRSAEMDKNGMDEQMLTYYRMYPWTRPDAIDHTKNFVPKK